MLKQLIHKPTRIIASSATLHDIVITNKPKSVIHFDTIPWHTADYGLIILTIDLKKEREKKRNDILVLNPFVSELIVLLKHSFVC